MNPLSAWQNFYMIMGSSAGALTGLQFVVMALVADLPSWRGSAETNDAFGTPTIVHFGVVLLLAGMLSAPWHGAMTPLALCSVCGIIGLIYVGLIVRRMRGQSEYHPVVEDWLFHVILPAIAYAMLAAAVYVARDHLEPALFSVAAVSFLLLFIGIHNAWDTITYLVTVLRKEQQDAQHKSSASGKRRPR